MPEPLMRWCDRCDATVPLDEWDPYQSTRGRIGFRHVGEQRGVIQWDGPDHRCNFVLITPEPAHQEGVGDA